MSATTPRGLGAAISNGSPTVTFARFWTSGPALVAFVAAAKLALHLATANLYGLFIDELYFLACGEHLAWGYVDMPPLTAVQCWLTRLLFGDSLYSIRLFPALAGAGLVLLTGVLVRQLGGGRFAQGLAAVCVALAPGNLAFDSYISMNSLEPLIWMGCAALLVRMIQTGNTRLWVPFGLLAGIGLLNKHTMVMFGFALVAGLLISAERRLLFNRWLLLGGALAFLIVLPNLLWEVRHGFPHLEMLANIRRNGRDVEFGPLEFMLVQVVYLNPLALPVWGLGLGWLLAARGARRVRFMGIAYLVTLGALLAAHGKVYYLLPAYPMLFAAGASAAERCLRARPHLGWLRPAYVGVVLATGLVAAPVFTPILSAETYLAYAEGLHIPKPSIENRRSGPMPQHFADRFGWPEMVAAVARVYHSLPADERARCAIIANDYGQAGAIDFYGPALGLPKAVGVHVSYWLWGPRDHTGEVAIVLGDRRGPHGIDHWWAQVEERETVGHPYAMLQEHFTIYVARQPRGFTLAEIWPQIKKWD